MPWIAPSHQAPALLLKTWRPAWFSGLALVLGTMAPDLEFILRMDNEWIVSHTLAAQIYFTVPLVAVLYWLTTEWVVPWATPYLADVAPSHCKTLGRIRLPPRAAWGSVAVSGALGGLTHITLDGFTHGGRSGWAVALLPFLRRPVGTAGVPLHDVLQIVLSLGLALATFRLWTRWMASAATGERLPGLIRASAEARARLAGILAIAALAGAATAQRLHPALSGVDAAEVAVYGAMDFVALAVVVGAGWERLRTSPIRAQAWGGA